MPTATPTRAPSLPSCGTSKRRTAASTRWSWFNWRTKSACRLASAKGRGIEPLSPLADATRDADARAFAALMRHVKAADGREHTVVMVQLENEIGVPDGIRDRSPAARQAYAGQVPKHLTDYL